MPNPARLEISSAKGQQTIVVSRDPDRRVTDILRREHLPLNTRCGQRGLCDGCIVELVAGELIHHATGECVVAGASPLSLRLCEYRVATGAVVSLRIPPRSLLAYEPQVVSEFRTNVPRAHDPLWQTVEIPRVEIHNGHSASEALAHAVAKRCQRRRPIRVAESVEIPAMADTVSVTLNYRGDHWLASRASGTRPNRGIGAAIDIGTTTVAVLLVDLSDGRIVGRGADFNKQMHLGDDVATRIGLCAGDPAMLAQLQDAILNQTIAPLLSEPVACVAAAGNTTMLHLLAGVDPSPMGVWPFRPEFLEHRVVHLPVFGEADVHLLPSCAAYIGADLTAGIFSSGMAYDDGPSLLVDVGTNGEIILKHGNHLLGCATAAGPAFEGAGLTNGVRAGAGAIERVQLAADPFAVKTSVIGDTVPIGLCGSAYVDFLAEARRVDLLTPSGRFNAVSGSDNWLTKREETGLGLRVGRAQGKQDVIISETDIAHLLQSKAAVAAGILTLIERAGLTPAQIKRVYLAGGFGMHLNIANAIGCGLLPGFSVEQVQLVGNTSLAGAYLSLLDSGVLDELTRISKRVEVIELNLDAQFEDRYVDQLSLP